ncbi:uncharacterized protein LOC113386008 [Ctenocephalides felis]|uniref:uncharacterized protein LOC113386008 n=1 Tax=Ctenocephalides felis TaxID=7515 RepID=UPI000E6E12B1|nr:uncharacterized protein LOC113386008 [Ctenocephalides felis]
MVVKAAIEFLRKADVIKEQLTKFEPKDFATLNVIALLKELQHIYRHIFVIDINYALTNKIDQDLWNIGFKLCISSLQDLIKNKEYNVTQKSEFSAVLSWYLSGASGFYINLLNSTWGAHKDVLQISTDLSFVGQYCLVHLGDLARYQGHKEQAQNFYEQAIKVAPAFGHAYNQLALLEPKSSSMDALKICSLYCRANSCVQSFMPAHNNLMRLLEEYKTFECSKISTLEDYISAFLKQMYYVLNNSIYDMKIECPVTNQLNNKKCIEAFILVTYSYSKIIDAVCKESELSKDEEILKQIILTHYTHLFYLLEKTDESYKTAYLFLSWIMRKEHLIGETIFKKSFKMLENHFILLTSNVIESDSGIDDSDGILDEELELTNYIPFGLTQNKEILSDFTQDEVCGERVLKWTKLILEKISKSADVFENTSNATNNDEKAAIVRMIQPGSAKSKPKRARTNVALQTILQMKHNLDLKEEYDSNNEREDKAMKSLYSLPIESPTVLSTDWIDENSKSMQDIDLNQSTSIYSNFSFLEENGLNYTSLLSGMNGTSSLWGNGGGYSLFSGHSPLAKLLEDQKTKYDTNVIK